MNKQVAKKLLPYLESVAAVFVVCILSVSIPAAAKKDYAQATVGQLIDDLTQIDSQSPTINSAAIYKGFIVNRAPESFQGGVLGVALPEVPPQMRELVRRGSEALPELIKHIEDARPTKLKVGNDGSATSLHQAGVDFFMFSYFSDEYDPRLPQWPDGPRLMEKNFQGQYTVKVGDVCYVLIGQIVNRQLLAVRYQPSGGLVVNSPLEAPTLAERVRKDWGKGDAETLRASLLADIRATNRPKRMGQAVYTGRFTNPAMERLRLYFPDTYNALQGDDLKKRKEFEARDAMQNPAPRSF